MSKELRAGYRAPSGCGYATVLPDMDFETYSEAGYVFDEEKNKWVSIVKQPPHGIGAVGAPAYAEHSSTEVLSMAYDLKDGIGKRLWLPCMPDPEDLIAHVLRGGLLEAHNSAFEYYIWNLVCVPTFGWPHLEYTQLRCSMAKARAFSLPGKLGQVAKILNASALKIEDGKRLLNKFSKPRSPTKKDPRRRIRLEEDPKDAQKLYEYNIGDIEAEAAISLGLPDLSDFELQVWLLDQKINFRGVAVDVASIDNCIEIVNQATAKYTSELQELTDGCVKSINEIGNMKLWMENRGFIVDSLKAEDVDYFLEADPEALLRGHRITLQEWPIVRRVLELRKILGSASVKKLFAMKRRVSSDGRLRDLFAYCGADRTGRFSGKGPQPQNLPRQGPDVAVCDDVNGCGNHYKSDLDKCPWCSTPGWAKNKTKWGPEGVEDALDVMTYKNLSYVESVFGDPITTVSGCLRGLFVAGPGKDLICSDYSAIEAVCLAMLAGEEWRAEVFRTHGKIYEMSASKITGVPFDEFIKHKEEHGEDHPLRKSIGKIAELASGYQGGYGAWINFGADKYLTEKQIKDGIKAWRRESPSIVNFWYALERAAISAIQNPGRCYGYRGISFGCKDDVLYCQLLSGRKLVYHQPRLHKDLTPWGKEVLKITYMGWNSDHKKGPAGWMRLDTYGGKLCENITQATARDILVFALLNLESEGYPVVLHVHDEPVSEVPVGFGSVEEFEQIISRMPHWAADWPITASGGWRGKRYRKD